MSYNCVLIFHREARISYADKHYGVESKTKIGLWSHKIPVYEEEDGEWFHLWFLGELCISTGINFETPVWFSNTSKFPK